MSSKVSTPVLEREEVCFDYNALGRRWGKHPKTAARIMKRHGLQPMRLTARSVLFRGGQVSGEGPSENSGGRVAPPHSASGPIESPPSGEKKGAAAVLNRTPSIKGPSLLACGIPPFKRLPAASLDASASVNLKWRIT